MSQITSKYFQIGKGYKLITYKHTPGHSPWFNLIPIGDSLWPVDAIQAYLRVCGNSKGLIFCQQYNTHSSGIGRVTELANNGTSDRHQNHRSMEVYNLHGLHSPW